MDQILTELSRLISQINIQEGDKMALSELVDKLKREHKKNDFKFYRFVKDKSIVINLLKASMDDMEKKSQIIENANKLLVEQKQLIEEKNSVLEFQKKQIEEQAIRLEENLDKLTLSYSELEQFTYIASHDLKSPLRTITNFGQLLSRRLGDSIDGESREFLDFMINGAKQMNTVICDLLEYAHVGNKKQVQTTFDLSEVLDIVKFNLAEPIKESKAKIICETLPQLYGLRSGVIQLFQNLIGNAIKFRKSGAIPVIQITFEDQAECYYFEVRDNGVGMEEEFQNKAFLPFQRINNLERPGSGMGLAICKKIVHQHGGEIHFRSKRGEGTTFCFSLSKLQHITRHRKTEALPSSI